MLWEDCEINQETHSETSSSARTNQFDIRQCGSQSVAEFRNLLTHFIKSLTRELYGTLYSLECSPAHARMNSIDLLSHLIAPPICADAKIMERVHLNLALCLMLLEVTMLCHCFRWLASHWIASKHIKII